MESSIKVLKILECVVFNFTSYFGVLFLYIIFFSKIAYSFDIPMKKDQKPFIGPLLFGFQDQTLIWSSRLRAQKLPMGPSQDFQRNQGTNCLRRVLQKVGIFYILHIKSHVFDDFSIDFVQTCHKCLFWNKICYPFSA